MRKDKHLGLLFLLALFLVLWKTTSAQVWQWSVTVDSVISEETKVPPVAFLWIPENCRQVRGVVVGQHNMIEEGIFENPAFRKAMSEIGFAIVWVSPMFNINFDFTKDAGEDFTYMMKKLAHSSGYEELAFAPIVPIGHSATATYSWNLLPGVLKEHWLLFLFMEMHPKQNLQVMDDLM